MIKVKRAHLKYVCFFIQLLHSALKCAQLSWTTFLVSIVSTIEVHAIIIWHAFQMTHFENQKKKKTIYLLFCKKKGNDFYLEQLVFCTKFVFIMSRAVWMDVSDCDNQFVLVSNSLADGRSSAFTFNVAYTIFFPSSDTFWKFSSSNAMSRWFELENGYRPVKQLYKITPRLHISTLFV